VEPAKKEAPVVVKEAKEAPVAVKEAPAASKEANKDNIIKGTVKEIAEDGSYLVVNDTKIAATKEFLDDSYLEVGDKVEITVEKTATGLKATNYNYVFEEEEGAGVDEKTGGAAGGNVADAGSNATDLGGE
jgi:ribosomal protein S1